MVRLPRPANIQGATFVRAVDASVPVFGRPRGQVNKGSVVRRRGRVRRLPQLAVEAPHLPTTVASTSGRRPYMDLIRQTGREVAVHGATVLHRVRTAEPPSPTGRAEKDGAGGRIPPRDEARDKGTYPPRAFGPRRVGAERVRVDKFPTYIGRTRRPRRHGKPDVAVHATRDIARPFVPSCGALAVTQPEQVLAVMPTTIRVRPVSVPPAAAFEP